MNPEAHIPTAQVYTGTVYGMGAQGLEVMASVEVVRSTEVATATGAAMLNAESYVDRSVRGQIYSQVMNEQATAAAAAHEYDELSALLNDDRELQDA
jgi:hypothetical protein